MTRAALHGFYWRWQRRLVPGLRPSQRAYAETLARVLTFGGRWLDSGCGRRPLPARVPEALTVEVFAAAARGFGADLDFGRTSLAYSTGQRGAGGPWLQAREESQGYADIRHRESNFVLPSGGADRLVRWPAGCLAGKAGRIRPLERGWISS